MTGSRYRVPVLMVAFALVLIWFVFFESSIWQLPALLKTTSTETHPATKTQPDSAINQQTDVNPVQGKSVAVQTGEKPGSAEQEHVTLSSQPESKQYDGIAVVDDSFYLWQPQDVITSGVSRKSDWVDAAEVLAVISISADLLTRFAVGETFTLPVGENPTYRVETMSSNDDGDISWMVANIKHRQNTGRYGVISEGKSLLLMTLYTDEGVYYLRSADRLTAEVSFVDYAALRQRFEQKEAVK